MEKIRYEEMLPHEIVARREKFPAAFVGLGGLEWHGEHLAVGNDALKAEKLCELAAAHCGGFAFPTLWYGEPRVVQLMEADHDNARDNKVQDGAIKEKMGFKKEKFSLSYFGKTGQEQIQFYRELLYHLLVQLNTLEMRAVCLVCGHYPLKDWATPAVEKFNRGFADTQAFAGIEFDYCLPNPDVGGDHAAAWETSYLWYLRPDCVDMSVYLGRSAETLIGVGSKNLSDLDDTTDPRMAASIEKGRKACNLIVGGMVKKAQELITQTR